MTCAHGRHLGLVRGGAGSKLRPVLQAGNRIMSTWRARLDEHLGHYVIEGLDARAASFLQVPHALYGVTHLAALCRLLPERDPHPQIHAALDEVLDGLVDPRHAAPSVVRFELMMLAELGFGLDLATCAATGSDEDLVYVSPSRDGRYRGSRASRGRDRLLPLPAFLGENAAATGRKRSRRETSPLASRSPGSSWCAMCSSRALRLPMRARASCAALSATAWRLESEGTGRMPLAPARERYRHQ
jgi:DNA repair protein RecO (recombination protein O)